MLAQLFVAVVLIAPEGPLWYRYSTLDPARQLLVREHHGPWLRQHPAADQPKMMEVSNVAFFRPYRMMASRAYRSFGIEHSTPHCSSWRKRRPGRSGVTSSSFAERWKLSRGCSFSEAPGDRAHPTAFYLVTGYSESLFLMALLGFIYWSGAEGRKAKLIAAAHGIPSCPATRIVGVPCAGYPVIRQVFTGGWARLWNVWGWFRQLRWRRTLTAVSTLARSASSSIATCAGVRGTCTCSRRRRGGTFIPITSRS
jgi:hypothetical protein